MAHASLNDLIERASLPNSPLFAIARAATVLS